MHDPMSKGVRFGLEYPVVFRKRNSMSDTQTAGETATARPRRHRPYRHPSAWKASDLGSRQDFAEPLTERHIRCLEDALTAVRQRGIPVEGITRDDFPLDPILDSVQRWEHEIQQGRGLLLLTGLPVDRFSKEDYGIMYYGLGTHFGVAQSQSLMGDRLGHVINIGGKDTRERAYRNSVELAMHTDASDIVGMLCLTKAWKGGMSGYCSGPAVYNRVLEKQPELLDVLFRGYRYHLFGEEAPGESPVTPYAVPVFSECEGYLSVSYLRSYIELAYQELGIEKTEFEARALDVFDRIAHSPEFRLDFMMEPGDICLFNNYTVLHTRTEFFDHAKPERRRHLLRLWLRAWNPRPLSGQIGWYKSRKGVDKQQGKGTYYQGRAEYVEVPPPVERPSAGNR